MFTCDRRGVGYHVSQVRSTGGAADDGSREETAGTADPLVSVEQAAYSKVVLAGDTVSMATRGRICGWWGQTSQV